jgi:signal transduction histidine kinase/response regulator RpfG family c-di-GMP phosphodiesterase
MGLLGILTSELRYEQDIVFVRQQARQIADLLGFDSQEQTRIATAVSEIARNAFKYAGGGAVEFQLETTQPQSFMVTVRDKGPGIADLKAILDGRYKSETGMGMGIIGAKRLMDAFDIQSAPGEGTRVVLVKDLPRRAGHITATDLGQISAELAKRRPHNPMAELQHQNRELLRTMEELRQRQSELARLNSELEDTNRGVVALYAELDDRADYLQRASELKSRFLSNMSHEFRTPLNAILSLSRLLLDRTDGELTPEQEKQVSFIRRSAEDLSELVNDLLDLAKVEAGKVAVRPHEFEVSNLFGALRGMLRPLLAQRSLEMVFEDPHDIPTLYTDEGKVSQVLRNFISNALKFTEKGEVRVSARLAPDNVVVFSVNDTGIGIAAEDQERIFQEWVQVETAQHKRVRGTGLGLPLSRKLAQLLGGNVWVESALGVGSTFFVAVPIRYGGPTEAPTLEVRRELDPTLVPVLVVEDNPETMFVYEKYLKGTRFQLLPARTVKEARQLLRECHPAVILLDILLENESTWGMLAEVKNSPHTSKIPVMVITVVDNQRKAASLGADEFAVKPVEREWLLERLETLAGVAQKRSHKALVIDDEEVSRYLLRGLLADSGMDIVESTGGLEGIEAARREWPDVVFLDLIMPGMDGFEVLERMKSDPTLARIPVVVYTSKQLSAAERKRLAPWAAAIVSKEAPSRQEARAELRNVLQRAGLQLGPEPQAVG